MRWDFSLGEFRFLRVGIGGFPNEFDPLTYRIIGAAVEVHRLLGPGLLESVYEVALCHEFRLQGIEFEHQEPVEMRYKDILIGGRRIDLVVGGEVVVELKSQSQVPEVALAQVLSYLRSTGMRRGLIVNFVVAVLRDGIRRVVVEGGPESSPRFRFQAGKTRAVRRR